MIKKLFASVIFILGFAFLSVNVIAPVGTITITTPTDGSTFNVGQSVTVGGSGTVDNPSNPEAYGVTILWGDGTNVTCLPLIGTSGSFTYTTSPSNDHTYSLAGLKTITALLFHQCNSGKEPATAESTDAININIVNPPTCTIVASPNLDFGLMNPGTTSIDNSTTITNSGNTAVTPDISGTVWNGSPSGSMVVEQTHWSTTIGQNYFNMINLTSSDATLVQPVSNGNPLTVYFKLSIPAGQTPAQYSQTITFTASC